MTTTPAAATTLTPWSQLLAIALIGTDRRGDGGPPLEVLDQAAAWSVARRAGRPPTRGVRRPALAPAEARELVPPAAAARLAYLLEAAPTHLDPPLRTALLAEWLTLAAAHRRIVPPEILPGLLELGRQTRKLRPLIAAAGGARAGWLARENPDWAYLAGIAGAHPYDESEPSPVQGDQDWLDADPPRRVMLLRQRRRREPEAARALLERDWNALPSSERADLLGALEDGLGRADEEFLERALDDRRTEVRSAAAVLLARLPGSQFNQRMAARCRGGLRVEDGRLAVDPPREFDAGMARDGLTAGPPDGVGARAWWLEEIVAHTPLAALTDLHPVQFLTLPAPEEWTASLHRGLMRAAAAQRDPVWATALLDAVAGADGLVTLLYPVLDERELARRAAAAIGNQPANTWIPLLLRCPGPWPEALGALALRALEHLPGVPAPSGRAGAEQVRTARQLARDLERLCDHAALSLPVNLAGEAAGMARRVEAADRPESQVESIARLAAIMELRHRMSQEFT